MDKQSALREYFGYTAFREGQDQLIDAILAGRDVFGIMPTGGGKSLCYQIPALLLSGITLVISPLISLMQDQVKALKEAGISAAYINSTLTSSQMRTAFSRIRDGQYKIIYIAPERLMTDGFLALANDMEISLIAVDEAHCISSWGQDFRPSYLKIVDFIKNLRKRPVVAAFTATATDVVRGDVERILELQNPLRVITGFDRPNLRYEVLSPSRKNDELLRILRAHPDESGIIYCATRKKVETVCDLLCAHDFPATRYHAGLSEEERRRNQEDFVYDRKPIMVATNAFGMGIDKSNVRYVLHYNMPQSLEAYYQEAGRAGRDGEASDCVLLYSSGDVRTARFLIENGEQNEALTPMEQEQIRKMELKRLSIMIGYCKTEKCLRGYLLDYFGQEHPPLCGNCSNCTGQFEIRDFTREAQMILSCVKRIKSKLGYYVGAALVIRVLRGSKDRRIAQLHLDEITTYGMMRNTARSDIQACIDALTAQGYLTVESQHQSLRDTEKAREILFGGQKVEIRVRSTEQPKEKKSSRKESAQSSDLFEQLRILRAQIAKQRGIAAYMVFSDATLHDMACKKPKTDSEMLDVKGIGEFKLKRYGKAFLQKIAEFK